MKRKSFSFMTMAVCAISAALGGISYSSRMNQTSLLLKENLDALSDDNKETKKYRAYRCYLHEAQQGASGYVCPPETNAPVFYSCPDETKTISILSTASSCIKEEN